jgi:hypothetical protein
MRTYIDTAPVVSMLGGLASASSYTSGELHAADTLQATHAQVRTELRLAQVELYCDHDTLALHAIQRARRQLLNERDNSATSELAALDHAAWLLRHHDHSAAIATLDASRQRLAH